MNALSAKAQRMTDSFNYLGMCNTMGLDQAGRISLSQAYEVARTEMLVSLARLSSYQRDVIRRSP